MRKLLLTLTILMVIAGCSPKLSPDHYWSQRKWVLTEMKGVPVQLSGSNRDASLEFVWADKRFTGNGGCNRISGNYSLDKKEIKFGEVTSTKMSCPDIAFENTFLATLNSVDHFETTGNSLVLKDGKNKVLIFEGK